MRVGARGTTLPLAGRELRVRSATVGAIRVPTADEALPANGTASTARAGGSSRPRAVHSAAVRASSSAVRCGGSEGNGVSAAAPPSAPVADAAHRTRRAVFQCLYTDMAALRAQRRHFGLERWLQYTGAEVLFQLAHGQARALLRMSGSR